MIACGFPIETGVIAIVRPSTWSSKFVMGGGASILTGIWVGSRRGAPMLSRTLVTRPASRVMRTFITPAPVSTSRLSPCGAHDAVVHDELHEAAHAVSGHLRLRAIGVEDAHADRCPVRRDGEDEAVCADAEVAVADRLGERAPVPFELTSVDEDEVVSGAMQLGEFHGAIRISRRRVRRKARASASSSQCRRCRRRASGYVRRRA